MSTADTVTGALARYEDALGALQRAEVAELPSATVEALRARDALAAALPTPAVLDADALNRVARIDDGLRAQAQRVTASVGRGTLRSWRAAIQAPATAWWWSLETVADDATPASHPMWTILAVAFITLAISLATDISLRFLSGGADLLGLFSTFAQAALALLAGSSFTRFGGERVDKFLARRNVAKRSQGMVKTAFALAVLAVIVVLRLSLPAIARLYNDYGVELQQVGRITGARQAFERAIRLDPDVPQPHFNLASAFEETLDYDAALAEYQRAIKLDERIYPAYNNLARVYILRRGDHASALQLLDDALRLAPKDDDVQYSLYKNHGWANLGLKYFQEAQADLERAISLQPSGAAAAHCLLAQLLDVRQGEAMPEWEMCLALADDPEVEASWRSLAQERVQQGTQ